LGFLTITALSLGLCDFSQASEALPSFFWSVPDIAKDWPGHLSSGFADRVPYPPCISCISLKAKLGRSSVAIPHLPPVDVHGVIQLESEEILDRHSRKVKNRALAEVLVRWSGQNWEEASWEDLHQL
jgi:hypothetical protein